MHLLFMGLGFTELRSDKLCDSDNYASVEGRELTPAEKTHTRNLTLGAEFRA